MAWSSYRATYTGNGLMQFYATPTAGDIYNKNFVSFGFGSNASGSNPCHVTNTHTFDPLSARLVIDTVLCDNPPCQENPCPGILAPEAMGFVEISLISIIYF